VRLRPANEVVIGSPASRACYISVGMLDRAMRTPAGKARAEPPQKPGQDVLCVTARGAGALDDELSHPLPVSLRRAADPILQQQSHAEHGGPGPTKQPRE